MSITRNNNNNNNNSNGKTTSYHQHQQQQQQLNAQQTRKRPANISTFNNNNNRTANNNNPTNTHKSSIMKKRDSLDKLMQFEVVLECCHKVDPDNEVLIFGRSLPTSKYDVNTLIFPKSDIVEMIATDVDKDFALKTDFTDSAIASRKSTNGQHAKELECKELQPFPFEEQNDDYECDNGLDLDLEKQTGWSADDMLNINETKYGYKSTFKTDLTEYTLAVEREDTDDYRRREEAAEKIALEIESSSAYKNNVDKELSDNEEEETAFSAVERVQDVAHVETTRTYASTISNSANSGNNTDAPFSNNNKNRNYDYQNKNYQNEKYNSNRRTNMNQVDQRLPKQQLHRGIMGSGISNHQTQQNTGFKRNLSMNSKLSMDQQQSTSIVVNSNKNQSMPYNKRSIGAGIGNDTIRRRTAYNNNNTTLTKQDNYHNASATNTTTNNHNNNYQQHTAAVDADLTAQAQSLSLKSKSQVSEQDANRNESTVTTDDTNNALNGSSNTSSTVTSPIDTSVDNKSTGSFYSNNDMNNNNYTSEDNSANKSDASGQQTTAHITSDNNNVTMTTTTTGNVSSSAKSKLNPFAQEFNPMRSHMTSPVNTSSSNLTFTSPSYAQMVSAIAGGQSQSQQQQQQGQIPATQLFINPLSGAHGAQPIYVINQQATTYPPPVQTPQGTFMTPIVQQPPPQMTPQQGQLKPSTNKKPIDNNGTIPVHAQQGQQQYNINNATQQRNNYQNQNGASKESYPPAANSQPAFIATGAAAAFPQQQTIGQLAPVIANQGPLMYATQPPGAVTPQPPQHGSYQAQQLGPMAPHNPQMRMYAQNGPYIPFTQNPETQNTQIYCQNNALMYNPMLGASMMPGAQQNPNVIYAPPPSSTPTGINAPQSHTPSPMPQQQQQQQQQTSVQAQTKPNQANQSQHQIVQPPPQQQQPQQQQQYQQAYTYYIPSSPSSNIQGQMPPGSYITIPYPQPNSQAQQQQQYMFVNNQGNPYLTTIPSQQQQQSNLPSLPQQHQQQPQQQQMHGRMFFVQNPNQPYPYQNANY